MGAVVKFPEQSEVFLSAWHIIRHEDSSDESVMAALDVLERSPDHQHQSTVRDMRRAGWVKGDTASQRCALAQPTQFDTAIQSAHIRAVQQGNRYIAYGIIGAGMIAVFTMLVWADPVTWAVAL